MLEFFTLKKFDIFVALFLKTKTPSTYCQHFHKLYIFLLTWIFSSHLQLGLQSGLFLWGFSTKTPCVFPVCTRESMKLPVKSQTELSCVWYCPWAKLCSVLHGQASSCTYFLSVLFSIHVSLVTDTNLAGWMFSPSSSVTWASSFTIWKKPRGKTRED